MRIIGLMALIGLAACADVDLQAQTNFNPTVDRGGFEFQGIGYSFNESGDPVAEDWRMRQLNAHLAENAMCPNGFRIIDRRIIVVRQASLGEVSDIYYTGECA